VVFVLGFRLYKQRDYDVDVTAYQICVDFFQLFVRRPLLVGTGHVVLHGPGAALARKRYTVAGKRSADVTVSAVLSAAPDGLQHFGRTGLAAVAVKLHRTAERGVSGRHAVRVTVSAKSHARPHRLRADNRNISVPENRRRSAAVHGRLSLGQDRANRVVSTVARR